MAETLRTEVRQVSLNTLRDELRALWMSDALDADHVIRARSHNLVVYTDMTRHNVADLVEHIIQVNERRPGRVILIQYNPDEAERLEAWVTVYCHPQRDVQVCSEMIVIEVGRDARDDLHSTVVALLAPDLPVFLWWMQLPSQDDHLYLKLAEEADRLIVDSDFLPDLASGLPALTALGGLPVSDLAWARLTPWRRRVAVFWDARHLREPLTYLRGVVIQFVRGHSPADANRALLLVGWLAERLGWACASAQARDSGYALSCEQPGGEPFEVRLAPVEAESIPAHEIVSVTIEAGDEKHPVHLHLRYEPAHGSIEVAVARRSRRDWAFKPVDAAAALAEELDYDYDSAYTAALEWAASTVRAPSNYHTGE